MVPYFKFHGTEKEKPHFIWKTYNDAMEIWKSIYNDKQQEDKVRERALEVTTLWIDIDRKVKEVLTGMKK